MSCDEMRLGTPPGIRPPGDMDPRHEGLTIVTADSFRELVLESKGPAGKMSDTLGCSIVLPFPGRASGASFALALWLQT